MPACPGQEGEWLGLCVLPGLDLAESALPEAESEPQSSQSASTSSSQGGATECSLEALRGGPPGAPVVRPGEVLSSGADCASGWYTSGVQAGMADGARGSGEHCVSACWHAAGGQRGAAEGGPSIVCGCGESEGGAGLMRRPLCV